jgi:L-asparaginase / beta-aspartyl-peptidase
LTIFDRGIKRYMSSIVIAHGGVDAPDTQSYLKTVQEAALAGSARTSAGLLDAVEAAINVMELDPDFNAGYGSVLNRDGMVQADALIIHGPTGHAGAVAAIEDVATPVSVARHVLEHTPHWLLVGTGATEFAREQGFPLAECATHDQRAAWLRVRNAGSPEAAGLNSFTGQPTPHVASDTVGCVVCTDVGTAAGASTGGLFYKMPGRVGDSAIVGGGAYACRVGAAAATGDGESFVELLLTKRVNDMILQGAHPQLAVEEAIAYLADRRSKVGGLIAVDSQCRFGVAYNGDTFPVAVAIDGQLIEFKATRLPNPEGPL